MTPMPLADELLSSAEASALLGKTPRTVTRMAKAGILPVAHKLPGSTGALLFRRADVERLVKSAA